MLLEALHVTALVRSLLFSSHYLKGLLINIHKPYWDSECVQHGPSRSTDPRCRRFAHLDFPFLLKDPARADLALLVMGCAQPRATER